VYPEFDNHTIPLIKDHSVLARLGRLLRWIVTLCALVLLIDLLCVVVLWDDGVESLREIIVAEQHILDLHVDAEAGHFIAASMGVAHDWVFVKTGLGSWLSTTGQGPVTSIIDSGWVVVETAVLGLQLFAARLVVLLLCLPLVTVIGVAAITDGFCGWLMRRTSGARESGFIYHRAKRAIPAILIVLWIIYLAPPVVMDPRWIVPPFIALLAVVARMRVSYFKKHI
jgi:integrating conjugative element membrane protein (TIGR03747 family)